MRSAPEALVTTAYGADGNVATLESSAPLHAVRSSAATTTANLCIGPASGHVHVERCVTMRRVLGLVRACLEEVKTHRPAARRVEPDRADVVDARRLLGRALARVRGRVRLVEEHLGVGACAGAARHATPL